uniref:Mono-/di-acylglycerol lipase N-terminal domain-containing protein n=1 Tax=Aegilops tauschii TaxID=37682 RepID=M8BDV0_AEGTA
MSLACGLPLLECVYCLGCARWAWKRCVHSGHHDSATWGHAAAADFAPVPRMCRLVMANYAPPDLLAAPPLLLDPSNVVRRRTYADTGGRVTPYLVYLDHAHADIVLALRGLNLGRDLPCLLCLRCLKDTCIPEDAMLKDPRRLYAPGRIYHIVERKSFRCGRYPPVVKTAVPVDGRFEHVVLSCNATMDHAIVWIEREGQRALDLMLEKERAMAAPSNQQMERDENAVQREHVEEHKAALRRAATLSVSGMTSIYGTFDGGPRPERSESFPPPASLRQQPRGSWNDLIEQTQLWAYSHFYPDRVYTAIPLAVAPEASGAAPFCDPALGEG